MMMSRCPGRAVADHRPLSRLKIYAAELAPLLAPGERAEFLGLAMYLEGQEEVGQEPTQFDLETAMDLALGLPTPYLLPVADRLVSGTSLRGWPGCQAEGLARVLATSRDLLLTEGRLLVLELDGAAFNELWQVGREQLMAARWAPRLGQFGRVQLVFRDGSAVAVFFGVLSPGRAWRFLRQLRVRRA